jgi:hypothetical protein
MKMKKKIFMLGVLAMVGILVLASCATVQSMLGGQSSTQNSGTQGTRQAFGLTASTPLEQKLAVGTLKLEGTPLAITAQQAKTLLPLWQALKALPAQNTTAPEEITALYQQIEENMTPQQIQSIKDLTMNSSDMRDMMSSLGIQFNGGNGQGLSQSQQATRQAQRSQNGGGGGGGGFGGPGGPGGFGGPGGGGAQTTRTPGANRARTGSGIGALFVDPVIKLLQTKAAG